jgi:hypothetical protein
MRAKISLAFVTILVCTFLILPSLLSKAQSPSDDSVLSKASKSTGKIRVFIGDIAGPDPFISERFRMLLMEHLGSLNQIEIVASKESADYMIEGIGRIENLVDVRDSEGAVASAGTLTQALLSVKLVDLRSGRILLTINESAKSDKQATSRHIQLPVVNLIPLKLKEATAATVEKAVERLKKQMKWK